MTTLEQLIKGALDDGIELKEKDHAGTRVDGEDFRNVLANTNLPFSYYCGLSEYEVDGYWNELRTNDGTKVLDMDAPNEMTLEDWATYIDKFSN